MTPGVMQLALGNWMYTIHLEAFIHAALVRGVDVEPMLCFQSFWNENVMADVGVCAGSVPPGGSVLLCSQTKPQVNSNSMGANRKPTAKRDATMGSNGIQKVTMGGCHVCTMTPPTMSIDGMERMKPVCVLYMYYIPTQLRMFWRQERGWLLQLQF